MHVNLAAQALSLSVAAVLKALSPPETAGTANFCKIVNSYFDYLNVRSTQEHQRKKKPFLAPYTSTTDQRFYWMEDEFLTYLKEWKQSTLDQPGNFTENAGGRMFLS